MRRRSRTGGPNAQAPKAGARKSRVAPKDARPRSSSAAHEETRVARLTRERDEALARQTATSEILRVISQSPTDVGPVFDSIVLTAARLLRSDLVLVLLCDGATYSHAAVASPDGPFEDLGPTNFPIDPSANFPSRAIVDKKMLHLPDWSLIDLPEHEQKIRKRFGTNSALYLPLLRDGECIGLLTLVGKRPNTFGAAEIAQAKSFRDQALIAIENVRLFEAEQQRTRELSESLEQQTATSEVLQVISSSPGDLEPVFATMVENAVRICHAQWGNIHRWDGETLHLVASHNVPPGYDAFRRSNPHYRPHPKALFGRLLATQAVTQIADSAAVEAYAERLDPIHVAAVELGGARTALGVPMLKENQLIGALSLVRQEVCPFSDKQIAVVKNFAAQAVIAIENARLLNELRQRTTDLTERTADLTEALEQQTATADVLKVISRSTFVLQRVLDTLVESAARLCAADICAIEMREGDVYRIRAHYGLAREAVQYALLQPLRPGRASVTGRVALDGKAIHVHDVLADPEYGATDHQRAFGYRTILGVPLQRDGATIGVLHLTRTSVEPFSEKQIELATTFADQAVIAIENVRLFEAEQQRSRELAESLEQQTAISDVLRVISNSPSDVQPVLDLVAEHAARICEAQVVDIAIIDNEVFRWAASFGEFRRLSIGELMPLDGSVTGRSICDLQPVHIADMQNAGDEFPLSRELAIKFGHRTTLSVPLIRKGRALGAILVRRAEVRPFEEKHITLLKAFADQAAIAIENVRLFGAEQQRTRELTESLEQQTATSEVLQVISSSPGDLRPVFTAMLEKAVRICDAKYGTLYLYDKGRLRLIAAHDVPAAFEELRGGEPIAPAPGGLFDQVIKTGATVHLPDIAATKPYAERHPRVVEAVELGGICTVVGVPMLKENELIGIFSIHRREVRPFTDKQIALVTNFAAQAVIAIENTRLLNELRKSLQQQTATADVLKVISRSTFDLQLVLDTLVESAARLCEADQGQITRPQSGGLFWLQATFGYSKELKDELERLPFRSGTETITGRALLARAPVHILDAQTDPGYELTKAQKIDGYRTILAAPMLREGEPIGVIELGRRSVRPFSQRQIELLATFADQAVIAIENARLLNELRESLEQQTATSKVLDVISRSAFDLHAVFETVGENSVKLCGADRAFIYRFDSELLRMAASFNASQELRDFVEHNPIRLDRHSVAGRAALERRAIHNPDIWTDPEHSYKAKGFEQVRTVLGVPILKGDELLGVIIVYRSEVRPFTDKQIALVETFADQAAIAIENARLLDALRHRTDELGRSVEELRALGEVSQAVNSTLELETVLSTIVANAVQLSGTEAGAIYVFNKQQREFRLRATYGMDRELIEALTQRHIGLDEPNITPAFLAGEPIHVPDLREAVSSAANDVVLRAGFRALLIAPLLRGEDIVGMLVVRRRTPGTFPQNTIDLIKTFAAQSAVAIENARLFQNVETSLEDLRTTQDRLVQTQKLASLGQLTAGIAHEIKNPLNFVNNFSGVSAELIDELRETLDRVKADEKTLSEITELTNTLRDNLDKIVQHGKRVDAIVKNMLLHSREGSGDHRLVDANALVEESLNLAYHGARAEKQGFKINMERFFDPAAGQVDVFPQEITRALLNLISNGFYAATKRKQQDICDGYEPTLAASTKNLGDCVEIRIRDNGTGIPPEVREKMFNPFFTTKPAGEGTGLGLSITHDIIVKQHSGSIEVDTQLGEFTEIRIILSRAPAFPQIGGRV